MPSSSNRTNEGNIFRIAFGSCNNQNLTNPLWDVLVGRQPTAFIWAGDAIYADIYEDSDGSWIQSKTPATPERLERFYHVQTNNDSYKRFLQKTNVTLFGAIDDHDYGINNGDKTFTHKNESGIQFLRFIGEDENNIMFQRATNGDGVYGVKVLDFSSDRMPGDYLLSDIDAGIDPDISGYEIPYSSESKKKKDRRVAIFILDARSNKTPWEEGYHAWTPNYEGDFLGDKQWEWFETALRKSDASINIIVSSLQVHPYRHYDANSVETWCHFPSSRQRLYDAILQGGVSSPILLSGDVHMSQIMRKDCWSKLEGGAPNATSVQLKPLIEITSSGMTHSWGTSFVSSEKYYNTWYYYPIHVFSVTFMSIYHMIFPMPDLLVSEKDNYGKVSSFENGGAEGAKLGKQFSLDLNFGEIELDWEKKIVFLRAMGRHKDAPPLLSASYSFDQLSGIQSIPGAVDNIHLLGDAGKIMLDGNIIEDGQYICLNHRGIPSEFQVYFGFFALTLTLFFLTVMPHVILIRCILNFIRRKK